MLRVWPWVNNPKFSSSKFSVIFRDCRRLLMDVRSSKNDATCSDRPTSRNEKSGSRHGKEDDSNRGHGCCLLGAYHLPRDYIPLRRHCPVPGWYMEAIFGVWIRFGYVSELFRRRCLLGWRSSCYLSTRPSTRSCILSRRRRSWTRQQGTSRVSIGLASCLSRTIRDREERIQQIGVRARCNGCEGRG